MDTYTIAEAARLAGTSRGKLYQAIRTGQLQTALGEEPGQAMTVTRAALRAAGSPMPEPEAPISARISCNVLKMSGILHGFKMSPSY